MSERYSLEFLAKKFEEYSKISTNENKRLLKEFIENNPHRPVPQWFLETFNINDALQSICLELIELKGKMEKT